jgi:murein DD-endopeptidase MepM/ murein hydrolase activator NlpD
MAAGDGIIESIGHKGAYGKYIRIRHNSTYKTAYAHLSRYGKHIKQGHRVKQGATIGYVGSTGKSTGPHLHYEVIKNGNQTNPMSVRLPAGDKLNKSDLAMFKTRWIKLKKRVSIARKRKD